MHRPELDLMNGQIDAGSSADFPFTFHGVQPRPDGGMARLFCYLDAQASARRVMFRRAQGFEGCRPKFNHIPLLSSPES